MAESCKQGMAVIAMAAILLNLGCTSPKPATGSAPPDLPQVSTEKFLPAVRQEVQSAYEAARARPSDPQASGRLGMVLHAHGQFEAATTCYRRASALDPASFTWVYYLGLAQNEMGKNDEAAETLRHCLRLKPGDVVAQIKLAENMLSLGKNPEAQPILETITRDHPGSAVAAEAHYGLGRIAQQKDPAAAAKSLNQAIELFPAYGRAHYSLGLVYRTLGDATQAQTHLQLAERYKNAVPPVPDPLAAQLRDLAVGGTQHISRANDLERAGRLKEAVEETEKALESDPRLVQAHVNLISLYGRLDNPEKAVAHYREVVRLDQNSAEGYYNFGVLQFSQRKHKEALAAFQKALEINPFYAEAHNNLAYLLEEQGRVEDAIRHYRKAVDNKPDYRLAHFHLGRVLTNRKRYPEAIESLQKTLKPEDSDTPGFMYALAAAYARSGDMSNGLRYAREARQRAAALGQNELVASIDRDINTMELRAK